jgi:hypothetical protein
MTMQQPPPNHWAAAWWIAFAEGDKTACELGDNASISELRYHHQNLAGKMQFVGD